MAVFIGTFENKIDRKGRVSVPATFRQVLATQSFPGIVAFPSYRMDAIQACGMDFMEELNASVSGYDLFSDQHDDLAYTIFADSYQLPFDSEGRIVLPEVLIEHARLAERAAFVGKGPIFEVWEPEALRQQKGESRTRARSQALTLPLRQGDGGGR